MYTLEIIKKDTLYAIINKLYIPDVNNIIANETKETNETNGYGKYHRWEDHVDYTYSDCDFDDDNEEFTPYSGMYLTGDSEFVYCTQGEQEDFTACSSDSCGMCGRCDY